MPDPNTRYVAVAEAYLRSEAKPKAKTVNHLLLGDWVRMTGAATPDGWVPVHARNNDGFLQTSELSVNRPLEVNFVDIGQGDGCHIVTPDDRIILIDAGISDNMIRFLSWRYNLRGRKVAGVDGIVATDPEALQPITIDTIVMSHPDEDHYGGFTPIFRNRKLKPLRIFHNGIVERPLPDSDKVVGLFYPSGQDLGGYVGSSGSRSLWDMVENTAEMKALVDRHPTTPKRLLTAFRSAFANNPAVAIQSLSVKSETLPGFAGPALPEFAILGPVGADASFANATRYCLPMLGNKGVTKNGNSVVFRMTYGKLSVLLGGDLNTESEDYLARNHLGLTFDLSKVWADAEKLRRKGSQRTAVETVKWNNAKAQLDSAITAGRAVFRVDVAKACHHGSHHFTEPFLQMIDATATVISSGDSEPHCHPRPDALGAFGKYGRGIRPLVFSTELARSTREFSPLAAAIKIIEGFEARIAAATSDADRKAIKKEMEEYRDRNVAVYGMITLRTDGNIAILAQKLEEPRTIQEKTTKWDMHELVWNDALGEFEYHR